MSTTQPEGKTSAEASDQEVVSEKDLPSLAKSAGSADESDVTVRDVRLEIAVAVGVVLFGISLVGFGSQLRQGAIPDPVTTGGLPVGTGIFMIVLGSIVTLRAFRAQRAGQAYVHSEGSNDEAGFPARWTRVIAFVIGCLAWAYLIPRISYPLATPFFLALALWGLDVRSWMKLIVVPLVFTIVSWFLFAEVLSIRLPLGIFEAWARSQGFVA